MGFLASSIFFFRLFCFILTFQIFVRASDVLTLNEATFKETIQQQGLFLVKFFAPWCGHCKALAPEYEEAATLLKNKGITLIKIDCTVETRLCEAYSISGYPTLKVFNNGEHTPYEGARKAASIVSYMIKQSLPVTTEVDIDNFNTFKTSDEVVVIALLSQKDASISETYSKLAKAYRNKFVFGVSSDTKVLDLLNLKFPSLLIFKKDHDHFILYGGGFSYDSMEIFVNSESLPLLGELRPDTYERYIASKLPLGCIFYSSEAEKTVLEALFRVLAMKYKGYLALATIDAKLYGGHAENLNLKQQWPAFAIQETVSNKKYPFDQTLDINDKNVRNFIDDYLSGNLLPSIKSQPVPTTQDGPVTVVVANNFNDLVVNSHTDVLLEIYAPWCGHCKKLAPKYDSLGLIFKSNSNLASKVTIAKIDATANDLNDDLDIKGFPTILLFPAHDKKNPVEYSGPRTIESLIEFIHQKGSHKIDAMDAYLSSLSDREFPSPDADPLEHDEL